MKALRLPPDARVLVVVLRRLGDVLLSTPLIHSLRVALPAATIDALVFEATEGILTGNPDLTNIIAVPRRLGAGEYWALLRRLLRRYDLALSTQTGDRPTMLAVVAGRYSVGPVEAERVSARVKRWALSRSLVADRRRHRIPEVLRLAEAIGIAAIPQVVCPSGTVRRELAPREAYAVIHAAPMFTYKRWTSDGWRCLATALRQRGLSTVATGGKDDADYLDRVWDDRHIVRLDGRLEWPELTALIRGAQVYIGPDTAITHLAAATGAPTVALYGPTNPQIWGPWPSGGLDDPWQAAGTMQRRGNVWLVQNPLSCLPCQQEGCDRHLDSRSQCLDELSVSAVIAAVDQALAARRCA